MDANSEDLSGLEKRLAGWVPAPDGLDADALLFAAGRASARRGRSRLAWPAAALCLGLLAAGLGVGLARERAERLALARRLEQRPAERAPAPRPAPEGPGDLDHGPLAPDSYLAGRRALERDPDGWQPPRGTTRPAPAVPERPTLRAWNPGPQLEPSLSASEPPYR
jgi:hypothetical protein